MPSSIKMLMVSELARRFRDMPYALLADFTGLTARQADDLRSTLRRHGGSLLVVKNSLAILALRQLELLDVAELLQGPTAFVCGAGDPVALTRVLVDWSRKQGVVKLRGAMLEGRALDERGVAQLATLPPLQVLRAQVVGALAGPLTSFVGVLQAVPRSFAGVVKAIADKREAQG